MYYTLNNWIGSLILILVIWYIQFKLKRRRLYKLAAEFNGPPTLPLIGNASKCWIPLTEVVDVVLSGTSYYKSPARLWVGPYLMVHIWDPEDLKIVLNSPHALAKQPFAYSLVEMVTLRGLLTLPVDLWKRHRQLIGPIFKVKNLENFLDIFQCHVNKVMDSLHDKVGKGIFNIHNNLESYTMGSTLDALLEFDDGTNSGYNSRLAKSFYKILSAVTLRLTNIWYASDFIFNNSPVGRRLRKTKKEYDGFLDVILEKWRKTSVEKHFKDRDHDQRETLRPTRLVEHLMSVSDGSGKFTPEELRAETSTLIVSSLETTSTALGFTLLMVAMHQDVQEKTYQEIKQVLGTKEKLEYSDLKALTYLEHVIKETLRIFPPGAGVMRYNDQEIKLTNHTIPVHTNIVIGLLGVHRDPNIWPNPTKFDPDRFLPEEEAKRHPYSWIPFSGGARNCIGLQFAMISMKLFLSNFLLKYKVRTDYKSVEDVKLTMILVLQATNGYKINISHRGN